jgi:hypothetical protein
VFDHPSVDRLSRELLTRLVPPAPSPDEAALRHLMELEAILATETVGQEVKTGLERVLARWGNRDNSSGTHRRIEDELRSADAQEVFDFIDREFGEAP